MTTESSEEYLQLAGKLGLTALVPPIGLPLIFKNHKGASFVAGVGLSILLNVGYDTSLSRELYDNPPVGVSAESNNEFLTTLGLFASPVMFINSGGPVTVLQTGHQKTLASEAEKYTIYGNDVITFDPKSQKYTLSFNTDRKFKADGIIEYRSISEAQVRWDNLAGKLERLTAQGDISGARKAVTEIASEKARYDATVSQYNETKAAYTAVVAKMNAELDSLKNFERPKGD